jgi:predicted dienelactone hydrolase
MLTKRRTAGLLIIGLVLLLAFSIAAQLEIPEPTGPYAVGRTSRAWIDGSRPEVLTETAEDLREVPVEIWYPAEPGTGTPTGYFPDLEQVAPGLAASGEVSPVEVFGLRFIRSHELRDARLAEAAASYPVVLLSPGNGTNVEFYAALAGELASHGYIVVGLNHPYDVAAVALQDGSVAQFTDGPFALELRQEWVAGRIAERTADARFVLDQLAALNAGSDPLFAGRLDLNQVGIMGHSLGGISAAQACLSDPRLHACLNLDGQQQGGPFSTSADPEPPDQPFMYITKEEVLHPAIRAVFEAAPSPSYRVVVRGASHDHFTDGPLLIPSLLPLPNAADRILALTRGYTLAFFEQALRQRPSALLEKPTQSPQVVLDVFPSLE